MSMMHYPENIAEKASGFDQSITVENDSGTLGSLSIGKSISVNNNTYSLNKTGESLIFSAVINSNANEINASVSGVTWGVVENTSEYTVNCSKDNFNHQLVVKTTTNALDTLGISSATYQYQFFANEESLGTPADVKGFAVTAAQKLISDDDGNMDLFFANGKGIRSDGYVAVHQGDNGTGEYVSLAGKNKIADVFIGSSDANVLVLTDDNNGDALFVEDIFTAFGDQTRLSQIDEIRAGFGDDVVDLTSQRFNYIGTGVTVYGGLGNDTIWASDGNNYLYGDAGNDRIIGGAGNDVIAGGDGDDSMHGGGGNDIFTLCDNWGDDTVEQIAGGAVTLWFENDPDGIWDPETFTYTAGKNRVKVIGTDSVVLKFGDDQSEQYDALYAVDAFEDDVNEKIFEDKYNGMLA